MSERNEYNIEPIIINNIRVVRVVIDTHYREKHADHMSDEIILERDENGVSN